MDSEAAINSLNKLLESYFKEVIEPLNIIKISPQDLPKNHFYWKDTRQLVMRIQRQIEDIDQDKSLSVERKNALIGGSLVDMVNLYVLEILGEYDLFKDGWKNIFLNEHPYRAAKHNFIYKNSDPFINLTGLVDD